MYQVSNLGNVRKTKNKRILKPFDTGRGYLNVKLSKNNIAKTVSVHRLVAKAFIPNLNNLEQVNHKDENKKNNNVNNLEWCTQQHNVQEAFRIGLIKTKKGAEHHLSRKVKQYDKDYNYIRTWDCIKDIEKELGFKASCISACCRKKVKRVYGYIWEYVEYIEVDKIRDKIKELEQDKNNYLEKQVIQGRIDLLKELLEGE